MLAYFISPADVWNAIASDAPPLIVDVRHRDSFNSSAHLLPAAIWREATEAAHWENEIRPERLVVVACNAGHERSQIAAAHLRAARVPAQVLAGGYDGWAAAGLPFVLKHELESVAPRRPSLWVTRRRPKIDRIACPWLVRRFLDPHARFFFVDPQEVVSVALQTGGIPFDIDNVELSHEGERCTFDTLLRRLGLESYPALAQLAQIVRGADTARYDIAPEAAGLHAVSLGLSALAGDDDHGLLRRGFHIYDALLAWLRFAAGERHNWPSKQVA